MRCFLRFSLLAAFSGVAVLAIWPFLPKMHKEALNFYKAWEVVREATESTAISANQEEEVQTEENPTASQKNNHEGNWPSPK